MPAGQMQRAAEAGKRDPKLFRSGLAARNKIGGEQRRSEKMHERAQDAGGPSSPCAPGNGECPLVPRPWLSVPDWNSGRMSEIRLPDAAPLDPFVGKRITTTRQAGARDFAFSRGRQIRGSVPELRGVRVASQHTWHTFLAGVWCREQILACRAEVGKTNKLLAEPTSLASRHGTAPLISGPSALTHICCS